jgi:hypothetical protein
MLLRSNNVIDPCRLTATWCKLLAAAIAILLILGTLVSADAQYYYPRPPDYGYAYPPPDDRYGYGWTWNDCPPGWTVQGGNCAPYKGSAGAGWRARNDCPPGYAIQSGACQPYRGRPRMPLRRAQPAQRSVRGASSRDDGHDA